MKLDLEVTGTVAARVAATFMNLIVVAMVGHKTGAEGLGEVSLIILAITIIMLLNNWVGGGAITYLAPRFNLRRLLIPAYAWAAGTALVALLVTQWIPLVPSQYRIHVVALAFIQSIYTAHLNILLGREGVKRFNGLVAGQVLVLLVAYSIIGHFASSAKVIHYLYASYFAFGTTALLSTILIIPLWRGDEVTETDGLTRGLFRQGGWIQMANLMQLLNYRLAYYFIEHFVGLAALGIYSVGTQLSEGAWMVPKSIGTVLYTKVSQTEERKVQRKLTKGMLKIAMAACAGVLLVLLLLPDVIYQFIFGDEVVGVSPLILMLSPGIIAMAGSQALSHYFSGVGANRHNAISSGIGLVATVMLGLYLIPSHGLVGAAITASIAYTLLFIYQMTAFSRMGISEKSSKVSDPGGA